jgi:hypothetical protein
MNIHQDICQLDNDDPLLPFLQQRLSGVLNTIRGRIGYALSADIFASLSNETANYSLCSGQRLDWDFVGFSPSR